MIPEPKIQSELHRKFSSNAKYLLLHLNNYRFSKNNPDKEGPYIHREYLENRLESWLLNSSKSGSYLVSGYRGMGKSSLVDTVLGKITKELNPQLERWWNIASLILFASSAIYICHPTTYVLLGCYIYFAIILLIAFLNTVNRLKQAIGIQSFPNGHIFSIEKLKKILSHFDKSEQSYKRISIKINLGKEVLNAKDVMCLITTHIRNRYRDYLDTRHNRPLRKCIMSIFTVSTSVLSTQYILLPIFNCLIHFLNLESFFICVSCSSATVNDSLIRVSIYTASIFLVRWSIRVGATSFDKSRVCLNRLNYLADWIASEINEERKINIGVKDDKNPVSFSFNKHRGKRMPIATIRDIEAELIDIINTINSSHCLRHNRVQFIIVLDELDKVEQQEVIQDDDNVDILTPPEFTTTVNGFSNNASNNERKNVVLHILGNMKLFLTTAKAKFIFISGREMFDAFLADTSDREYAISSIFSGVINVNSFLYPDREQSDVVSLTEQYLAEILIPEEYLWKQTLNNAIENNVLKREVASLRWYTQYLTELADQETSCPEERQHRIMEIRHVVTFLHDFIAYLSHISKGAPKKIVLHLDEYIKRRQDCVKLYDWDDHIELGKTAESEMKYNAHKSSRDNKPDYVLYFSPKDQQKIGFISYLTAPLKNVLINSVSNYNDKLLIEASFLIDHLFKFHGRGFSWRNIEQTPELLDVSKTSDLSDFITSILEFMQQQHLSPIMVGLYKFKFRKRISEEIAYISRISDEAAALFNFTLNESKPTRQYNIRLLNYYMKLNAQVDCSNTKGMYYDVMSRIHATLADLYFLEENYARALQEYRNSISLLDQLQNKNGKESSTTIITRLRNTLKMALTCEYSKNYETAYAIYCNLVDTMISVREVDERTLGLALVNTWTNDWRIKQPTIFDPYVIASNRHLNTCDKSNVNVHVNVQAQAQASTGGHTQRQRQTQLQQYPNCNTDIDPRTQRMYEHQVYDLMWEDGINCGEYYNSEYSLNFENLISGFSKNLSPEKSHFIAKLSLFEDIRLVYKAILAKLFIVEKMNMSGITLSNIETAEAEFKYLHRTTNLKEKFFVSADFFNELGKILYYKNNITLPSANNATEQNDPKKETLKDSLYWCDIDLYAYLDEFCYMVKRSKKYPPQDYYDSRIIKDIIKTYYDNAPSYRLCQDAWQQDSLKIIKCTYSCFYFYNFTIGNVQNILDKIYSKSKLSDQIIKDIIKDYIEYVIDKNPQKVNLLNIKACYDHRRKMLENNKRPPCHACKYVKRSMNILTDYMFIEKRMANEDRIVFLLKNSVEKQLKTTRVNHLRLLASNIASMGNIMFSCADSPLFSFEIINRVLQILEEIDKDNTKIHTAHNEEREERIIGLIDYIKNNRCKCGKTQHQLTKIDKAILYYLVAFRYYRIAKLDKDASDCLLKILIIINNALTVVLHRLEHFNKQDSNELFFDSRSYGILKKLFEVIFVRYAKLVNRQGAYSGHSEVQDIREMLHMHKEEDINMTRSHLYTELIEAIWHIIDSEIKMLDIIKISHSESYKIIIYENNDEDSTKEKSSTVELERTWLIKNAYKHFNCIGISHNTFYSEVIYYYAKFNMNNYILEDIWNHSTQTNGNNFTDDKSKKIDYGVMFLRQYKSFMNTSNKYSLYESLFNLNLSKVKNKQELIEFIIEDSIVCLSEILYKLTPFNHISSFSNNFVAGVYNSLWRYAKMYETLNLLYEYNEHPEIPGLKYKHLPQTKELENEIKTCCLLIQDDHNHLKDKYGSLCNMIYTRLNHYIDKRTLKYSMSQFAAEMALRYYTLIESSYSEGTSYRNQVSRNYLLNDDLDNDTWLFNTAIERFRINTNYIDNRKKRLASAIMNSRFYKYDSYVRAVDRETEQFDLFDEVRFEDSLFTNTEL